MDPDSIAWPQRPPQELIDACVDDESGIPILADWLEDHGHDRGWAQIWVQDEKQKRRLRFEFFRNGIPGPLLLSEPRHIYRAAE